MFASTGTVNVSVANHFTYKNNNVVYYFNSLSMFDALFNFNACIGDKWLRIVHPNSGMCTPQRREVLIFDTGHVMLNSVLLKKIVLKYTSVFMSTFTTTAVDTVYEKIGSKKNFLFPFVCEGAILDPDLLEGGSFRCYSNNIFGSYNLVSNCNFILSIQNVGAEQHDLNIFPNPTTNTISVTYKNKINSITLFDFQGKQTQLFNGDSTINVESIPAGLYYLKIEAKNEKPLYRKFTKE